MQADGRESGLVRRALAVAAGLGVLALAGIGTAQSLGLSETAEASIAVPHTAHGALAAAERRFAASQGVSEADKPALLDAARIAPLADEPFAYLGFQAMRDGDMQAAEALLAEARDRRPRSRVTRYALLEIYGRRNDLKSMTGELVPLMRLEPELVDPLAKAWLKAIRRPTEVAALAQVLSREPAIYDRVAQQAANGNLAPDLLAAFVTNDPRSGDTSPPYVAGVLGSLVRQGRYEQAYRIWSAQVGGDARSAKLPFNGTLADRTAPPPFNWELMTAKNGNAAWRDAGGIFVDYFGRGSEPFARQLLRLPPGSYRIRIDQSVENADGRGLAWELRCTQGQRVLLDQPVTPSRSGNATLDAGFAVPAGCPAQWLAIVGRGELRGPDGQRALVDEVAITPQSGGVQQ